MIYTLTELRTYAREDLDNRLGDTVKYNDAWVDRRIEEGLAIAQNIKPIFYTKEKYDLTTNFLSTDLGGDGLTEVEIIPQKEVHSIYTVECDLNYFTVSVTPNNHIIMTKNANADDTADKTVVVRYFFYVTIPFTSLELTMEMFRFIKHGIAIAVYEKLQDNESEQYYQAKAESMVIKSTFDVEKDILNIPEERLWRGSWA